MLPGLSVTYYLQCSKLKVINRQWDVLLLEGVAADWGLTAFSAGVAVEKEAVKGHNNAARVDRVKDLWNVK